MQRGCLDKIYKQFGRKVLSRVPEFDGEIRGMEMIKLIADIDVWGGFGMDFSAFLFFPHQAGRFQPQ